ncbi:MAG: hypothetical protein QG650_1139 [Patescibacteria group bacterium]|nr:hypothetical protein [Patescibacteria group bacterium]
MDGKSFLFFRHSPYNAADMKTIRVHPASKLRQKFFTESVTADSQDNSQIFVGNHFWRTVLHPDFLRHFSAESGSDSIRVQEIATDLRIAGEIFSTAGEVFLSNEDLAFCF